MNEFIITEDFPKSEIEFDQRFLDERLSKNRFNKRCPIHEGLIFKIYSAIERIASIARLLLSVNASYFSCIPYPSAKLYPPCAIFSMLCTIEYSNH